MQRIRRSQSDRLLTGVCGGVADYFSIDPTMVRLIWIFFTLFGGSGLLAYIIATLLIPDSNSQERYFKLDSLKSNPLWGVLFIFSGLILFLQYDHIFYLFWASFWGNFINISIAFVLLGIGIYLLYNRQSQIKSNNKNVLGNPLHLSIDDKKLAGVCGGFGESLVIDPNIVRVLWVFGTFMSIGVGVLLYIILALILPEKIVVAEDI
jgi:phage shock protein PspC (stress-responsive transcriptional regulator)